MNFHPASGLFPLMDGMELKKLADDIAAHGLLEPIVLCDGKVLDGRNRLRACELAEVAPEFVEWNAADMSPTEWVVSMNLHRRHLTTAQLAALALDLLPHLEEEGRERMLAGRTPDPVTETSQGRSVEKAAELVGIGRTTVATAKVIQQRDPEIVNQMRSGGIETVAAAAREAGMTFGGDSSSVGAVDNGRRTSSGKVNPVHYGKGDKFEEAIIPAVRYFRAWKNRDYRFAHLNYKEARKRLKFLDELAEAIECARADLNERSAPAKLRV